MSRSIHSPLRPLRSAARPAVLVLVALGALGAVAAAPGAAGAQPWAYQSPLPTGEDLDGVHFFSADVGWISGNDRVLMRTFDGGATWTQTPSISRDRGFYEDELRALDFADSLHGWAVGNDNYRTVDGGATWQDMGFFGGSNEDVIAISPDVAYASSQWQLNKTTDGGQNWFAVFPADGIDRVNAMDWWDADLGVLHGGGDQPGSESGLYRSADGGATWDMVRAGIAADVTFVAPEVLLWHDGYGLNLYRSDDGGVTATPVLSLVDVPVEIIHRIAGDRMLVMDAAIRIWISEDGGLTWTQTHERLGARGLQYPGIHFRDSDHGWIVAEEGLILQTDDGGYTWTQRNEGIGANLESIHVYPDGRGVAVGDNGAVVTTENFGETWTLAPILQGPGGVSIDLVDLSAAGSRLWALDQNGRIHRSEDRGHTWTLLEDNPFGPPTWYNVVDFVDEDWGFIFGGNPTWGLIYRTADGGDTWEQMMHHSLLEEAQYDAEMFDRDNGVSLGSSGRFYVTDDGWSTWTRHDITTGEAWRKLGFANPQVGWVGGAIGNLAATTDGGLSWTPVALPGITSNDRIVAVEAANETEVRVLAAGWDQAVAVDRVRLYESFDGGLSWQVSDAARHPDLFSPQPANDMFVADTGTVWAVGQQGLILQRGGATTSADDDLAALPHATVLHPAVPNPFNPATEITFSLPAASHVRLQIHDLRGRAVATLVNETRAAGTHRVRWSGRDTEGRRLGSGVFLARLVWNGGSETVKLMLVQ